ncbi:phosphate acetyl/butaryl transferase domain-containing protein [Ditylenchus destructor]|nr:phosphate acetyl/butaryl transferase domain-containing protein [Ditylenchus destructor]
MNALMLEQRTLFIADTFVNEDPTAEELADTPARPPRSCSASAAAQGGFPVALDVRQQQAALGPEDASGARPLRRASSRHRMRWRDARRRRAVGRRASPFLPDSTLSGSANLLVLPTLDAANILFNVLKVVSGQGVTVGPILLAPSGRCTS